MCRRCNNQPDAAGRAVLAGPRSLRSIRMFLYLWKSVHSAGLPPSGCSRGASWASSPASPWYLSRVGHWDTSAMGVALQVLSLAPSAGACNGGWSLQPACPSLRAAQAVCIIKSRKCMYATAPAQHQQGAWTRLTLVQTLLSVGAFARASCSRCWLTLQACLAGGLRHAASHHRDAV